MVYSLIRNESQHLVEKIRSIDPFKVCASIIRKELRSFDFELNDRFCDAEDLKSTLANMCIPGKTLQFFGKLYNFDPRTYAEAANNVLDCEVQDEIDDTICDEKKRQTFSRTLSKDTITFPNHVLYNS